MRPSNPSLPTINNDSPLLFKPTFTAEQQRGTLQVPGDAEITPGVIGLPGKVGGLFGTKLLYAAPPKRAKAWLFGQQAKTTKVVVIPPDAEQGLTGLRVEYYDTSEGEKKDLIKGEVETGQDIIISSLIVPDPQDSTKYREDPTVVQVSVIERIGEKRADMPESGNDVRVVNTGYMYKADVSVSSQHTLESFKDVIFPKPPSLKDLHQESLGNCFLLATLGAILSRPDGADIIMEMFKQEKDYTIVRLFHPHLKTKTGEPQPVYVRVDNKRLHVNGSSAEGHTARWVDLLVAAYASCGWVSGEQKTTNMAKQQGSYDLAYGNGGYCGNAFKIITGQTAQTYNARGNFKQLYTNILPWMITEQHLATLANDCENILRDWNDQKMTDQVAEVLIQNQHNDNACIIALSGSEGQITGAMYLIQWARYIKDLEDNHPTAYQAFKKITTLENEQLRIGDIIFIVSQLKALQPQPSPTIMQRFEDYLFTQMKDQQGNDAFLFSAEPGKGIYTFRQLKILNTIQQGLANKEVLTASTLPSFDQFKHGKVAGLRATHAYSILGVMERNINNNKVYFVRLHNPWGCVGRQYDWNKQSTKENEWIDSEAQEAGTFDVELTEFEKYFSSFASCKYEPNLAVQNRNESQAKVTMDFGQKN